MKTLLLCRHAKAVGSDPGGDHERSLSERGRQQAHEAGGLLKRLGLAPHSALVSDSRRTHETAELIAQGAGTGFPVRLEADLYNASADAILALVRGAGSDLARLLVVGHNPGIAELARALAGTGEPQALIGTQGGFPTAAVAVIDFATTDWRDIAAGVGTLSRFIVPEALA